MKLSQTIPPPAEHSRQLSPLVSQPDDQSMSQCCVCACVSVHVCVHVATVNHFSRKKARRATKEPGRRERKEERAGLSAKETSRD